VDAHDQIRLKSADYKKSNILAPWLALGTWCSLLASADFSTRSYQLYDLAGWSQKLEVAIDEEALVSKLRLEHNFGSPVWVEELLPLVYRYGTPNQELRATESSVLPGTTCKE
jgi:hypothetical protein